MANNCEWAHVDGDTVPWILGPQDEAGDHQTPADEPEDSTTFGVAVGECVIFGQLADLRKFFIRCAAEVELQQIEQDKAKGESGE